MMPLIFQKLDWARRLGRHCLLSCLCFFLLSSISNAQLILSGKIGVDYVKIEEAENNQLIYPLAEENSKSFGPILNLQIARLLNERFKLKLAFGWTRKRINESLFIIQNNTGFQYQQWRTQLGGSIKLNSFELGILGNISFVNGFRLMNSRETKGPIDLSHHREYGAEFTLGYTFKNLGIEAYALWIAHTSFVNSGFAQEFKQKYSLGIRLAYFFELGG